MKMLWSSLERLVTDEKVIFRPNAPEQDIIEAEKKMAVTFPQDFRESLSIHDGQEHTEASWIPGVTQEMRLLPLEEILELWQDFPHPMEDDQELFDEASDDGKTRLIPFHPKRIPIAYDETADAYILLDFIPGPAGIEGQLIYNSEDADFVVLANNFRMFLELTEQYYKKHKAHVAAWLKAVSTGDRKKIEKYMNDGIDINSEHEGQTALLITARQGDSGLTRFLLSQGAKINAKTREGNCAAQYAAWFGQLDTLKLLIERGADLDLEEKGRSLLHYAAYAGDAAMLDFLLEQGMDVNRYSSLGTPLICAAGKNIKGAENIRALCFLLEAGADINAADNNGETALMKAAAAGHNEIVKELIARGANISATDNKGNTALTKAADHKRTKTAEILRKKL
jgi:ankyrin repeat protein/cell wall assembly regulator SMI1